MNIFTYGTLMVREIWCRVVKDGYRSASGIISGYARFTVAGERYPGLVESPSGSLAGVVYFDVNDADVARLDHFEGEEYERTEVFVELAEGQKIACQTYLFKHEFRHRLTDNVWSLDEFLHTGIKEFLSGYAGWNNN